MSPQDDLRLVTNLGRERDEQPRKTKIVAGWRSNRTRSRVLLSGHLARRLAGPIGKCPLVFESGGTDGYHMGNKGSRTRKLQLLVRMPLPVQRTAHARQLPGRRRLSDRSGSLWRCPFGWSSRRYD